jgi:hypothetical protein
VPLAFQGKEIHMQLNGLAAAMLLAATTVTQVQPVSTGSGQAYPQRPIRMIAA